MQLLPLQLCIVFYTYVLTKTGECVISYGKLKIKVPPNHNALDGRSTVVATHDNSFLNKDGDIFKLHKPAIIKGSLSDTISFESLRFPGNFLKADVSKGKFHFIIDSSEPGDDEYFNRTASFLIQRNTGLRGSGMLRLLDDPSYYMCVDTDDSKPTLIALKDDTSTERSLLKEKCSFYIQKLRPLKSNIANLFLKSNCSARPMDTISKHKEQSPLSLGSSPLSIKEGLQRLATSLEGTGDMSALHAINSVIHHFQTGSPSPSLVRRLLNEYEDKIRTYQKKDGPAIRQEQKGKLKVSSLLKKGSKKHEDQEEKPKRRKRINVLYNPSPIHPSFITTENEPSVKKNERKVYIRRKSGYSRSSLLDRKSNHESVYPSVKNTTLTLMRSILPLFDPIKIPALDFTSIEGPLKNDTITLTKSMLQYLYPQSTPVHSEPNAHPKELTKMGPYPPINLGDFSKQTHREPSLNIDGLVSSISVPSQRSNTSISTLTLPAAYSFKGGEESQARNQEKNNESSTEISKMSDISTATNLNTDQKLTMYYVKTKNNNNSDHQLSEQKLGDSSVGIKATTDHITSNSTIKDMPNDRVSEFLSPDDALESTDPINGNSSISDVPETADIKPDDDASKLNNSNEAGFDEISDDNIPDELSAGISENNNFNNSENIRKKIVKTGNNSTNQSTNYNAPQFQDGRERNNTTEDIVVGTMNNTINESKNHFENENSNNSNLETHEIGKMNKTIQNKTGDSSHSLLMPYDPNDPLKDLVKGFAQSNSTVSEFRNGTNKEVPLRHMTNGLNDTISEKEVSVSDSNSTLSEEQRSNGYQETESSISKSNLATNNSRNSSDSNAENEAQNSGDVKKQQDILLNKTSERSINSTDTELSNIENNKTVQEKNGEKIYSYNDDEIGTALDAQNINTVFGNNDELDKLFKNSSFGNSFPLPSMKSLKNDDVKSGIDKQNMTTPGNNSTSLMRKNIERVEFAKEVQNVEIAVSKKAQSDNITKPVLAKSYVKDKKKEDLIRNATHTIDGNFVVKYDEPLSESTTREIANNIFKAVFNTLNKTTLPSGGSIGASNGVERATIEKINQRAMTKNTLSVTMNHFQESDVEKGMTRDKVVSSEVNKRRGVKNEEAQQENVGNSSTSKIMKAGQSIERKTNGELNEVTENKTHGEESLFEVKNKGEEKMELNYMNHNTLRNDLISKKTHDKNYHEKEIVTKSAPTTKKESDWAKLSYNENVITSQRDTTDIRENLEDKKTNEKSKFEEPLTLKKGEKDENDSTSRINVKTDEPKYGEKEMKKLNKEDTMVSLTEEKILENKTKDDSKGNDNGTMKINRNTVSPSKVKSTFREDGVSKNMNVENLPKMNEKDFHSNTEETSVKVDNTNTNRTPISTMNKAKDENDKMKSIAPHSKKVNDQEDRQGTEMQTASQYDKMEGYNIKAGSSFNNSNSTGQNQSQDQNHGPVQRHTNHIITVKDDNEKEALLNKLVNYDYDKCVFMKLINDIKSPYRLISSVNRHGYKPRGLVFTLKTVLKDPDLHQFVAFRAIDENDPKRVITLDGQKDLVAVPVMCHGSPRIVHVESQQPPKAIANAMARILSETRTETRTADNGESGAARKHFIPIENVAGHKKYDIPIPSSKRQRNIAGLLGNKKTIKIIPNMNQPKSIKFPITKKQTFKNSLLKAYMSGRKTYIQVTNATVKANSFIKSGFPRHKVLLPKVSTMNSKISIPSAQKKQLNQNDLKTLPLHLSKSRPSPLYTQGNVVRNKKAVSSKTFQDMFSQSKGRGGYIYKSVDNFFPGRQVYLTGPYSSNTRWHVPSPYIPKYTYHNEMNFPYSFIRRSDISEVGYKRHKKPWYTKLAMGINYQYPIAFTKGKQQKRRRVLQEE